MIELFQKWDVNGDGEITKDEFRRALPEPGLWYVTGSIGHGCSWPCHKRLFLHDGPGHTTSVIRAWTPVCRRANPKDVDELFDSFDTTGDGSISFRELHRMLRRTRTQPKKVAAAPKPVVQAVDVELLRREVFKTVRSASLHAGIEASLRESHDDEGHTKDDAITLIMSTSKAVAKPRRPSRAL